MDTSERETSWCSSGRWRRRLAERESSPLTAKASMCGGEMPSMSRSARIRSILRSCRAELAPSPRRRRTVRTPRIRRAATVVFGTAAALTALALICAGCASPASSADSHNQTTGTLKVTVIQVGGPLLPGGGTPKQPVTNAEVKVASASASLSSLTGKAGAAIFRLPGGWYLVSSPTCGSAGKREVTVAAQGSTSLTWVCPVP
jgi:hypothetical protein